jgi:hydroxymethyl cephem carbamoyltransferase
MLVLAMKPGHDGGIAALDGDNLLFSIEAEKDSFARHSGVSPHTLLAALEHLPDVPDVVALGGWLKDRTLERGRIGTTYQGLEWLHLPATVLGKSVTRFASSHERSHIAMALGMGPQDHSPLRAVLVWEGNLGRFYLVDENWAVIREIDVMSCPGGRYTFVYALADPSFPDRHVMIPRLEDAGKQMALAAFADASDADAGVTQTVDRILALRSPYAVRKREFVDSAVCNAGVESPLTKAAAALITERIFERFAAVAQQELPAGIPLYISGGCGLNCDWNFKWRELGHFSSVFVPPCTDDSGSALGTAIDALFAQTGEPQQIRWDAYRGLEFEWDSEPDRSKWARRQLHNESLADALADGRVVAWVQGRWEIGPRALGNRSLLAEPFQLRTRDRLNEIKQREAYRPIAPCCRLEDVGKVFNEDFEDPFMLYFRTVRPGAVPAVTHVDGSARAQTVTQQSNRPLHDLLTAFGGRHGVGTLCNTSLNFKGRGFINHMSDLARYCEERGIDDMVVGDAWFTRVPASAGLGDAAADGATPKEPIRAPDGEAEADYETPYSVP